MTRGSICQYVDDAYAIANGAEVLQWLWGVLDRRRLNRFVYAYIGTRFQRQWTTAERNALALLSTHDFLAITDHITNVDPTKTKSRRTASEPRRHQRVEPLVFDVVSAAVTLRQEVGVHVGPCPFHYRSDCRIIVERRYDQFHCTECGFEGDAHDFLLIEMLWESGAAPYK